MDISSTQTIFSGVVVVASIFFAPASFCKQFFCLYIYSLICARLHCLHYMCEQHVVLSEV
jgi:hypothetical protein